MQNFNSIVIQAVVQALIGFAIWFTIKRQIDLTDRSLERSVADALRLSQEIKSLREEKVAGLETELSRESDRRKSIYQRLEGIELNYMSKSECDKAHRGDQAHRQEFIGAVLKLERNTVETGKLAAQLSEMQREQISIGKDLAGLVARVEIIETKGAR